MGGALVAAARDDDSARWIGLRKPPRAAPHGLRRPFLTEASGVSGLLQRRLDHGTAATSLALDLLQRMSGEAAYPLDARRALVDPRPSENGRSYVSSRARCPTRRSQVSCTCR